MDRTKGHFEVSVLGLFFSVSRRAEGGPAPVLMPSNRSTPVGTCNRVHPILLGDSDGNTPKRKELVR